MALNTMRLLFKELQNRRKEKIDGTEPTMLPHNFVIRDEPWDFFFPTLIMLISAIAWTLILMNFITVYRWITWILTLVFYWSWHEATDRITWCVVIQGEHMKLKYFSINFIKEFKEQSFLSRVAPLWLMTSALKEPLSVHNIIAGTLPNGDIEIFKWSKGERGKSEIFNQNVLLFRVETTHTAYELMLDYLNSHEKFNLPASNEQENLYNKVS